MRIVDASDQDLSGSWTNAGDRHDAPNSFIVLTDRFKLLDHQIMLSGECIELRQLDVKFGSPQFVSVAFRQWLAERIDTLAAGIPSLLAESIVMP